MGANVVFMRRTPKEIEVFGGEVYFDIDGKNMGILGLTDTTVKLENGLHKFKMYKSHNYDTFIGFAETEIEMKEGNNLLIRYAAPMLVTQPGNIIVSDFHSSSQVDSEVQEREGKITRDFNAEEKRKAEFQEKVQNANTIYIVLAVIAAIIFLIYMFSSLSLY
jgi:hypothetical protein